MLYEVITYHSIAAPGKSPEIAFQRVAFFRNITREFHSFPGIDPAFKDWIVRRIDDYEFEYDKDFCSFLSESTRNNFV